MSVPCGTVDGLPVGMQLVGRMYEEATIYRAAAFEAAIDWRTLAERTRNAERSSALSRSLTPAQ